jgi:magnesium transporter
MDAFASVISKNLNVVMKQLAVITIILMIPTIFASLYGMHAPNNFSNNPYGFVLILLISLAA